MLYANWRDECTDNSLEVAIFETLGEYNKVLEMIGMFSIREYFLELLVIAGFPQAQQVLHALLI